MTNNESRFQMGQANYFQKSLPQPEARGRVPCTMHLSPLLFLFLLLILPKPSNAQKSLTKEQQTQFIESFQDGDQFLAKKKYRKAQKSFEKAIGLKPKMAAAYRRLGVIHELLNEFEIAADYFEKCLEVNPELSRAVYFQAGEMHLKLGNYVKALGRFKEYQSFENLPPESFENGELELSTIVYFNTLIDGYLANCQFSAHKTDFSGVKIKNLGPNINSELDESFPYLANDESWMFYTRKIPNKDDDRLMYVWAEKEDWSKGKPLLNKKVNKEFNQGMGKVSRDEKLMYFPGCSRNIPDGSCNILIAKMDRDQILDISKLSAKVNSDSWDSQPSINCEGKSLYFVSNRPGGFGGTDIWVSHLQEDGEWTEAINLGSKINTPMDEESPFIADDNVTLFFASNGHPGFGDSDIFYTRNSENGHWSDPENLGKPVNSPEREISFFMNARGDKGYIASQRSGGFGGFDIYEFNMSPKEDFEEIAYIKGTVRDAATKESVESTVYIKDKGNYHTNAQGEFFVCYPTLSQLNVLVLERKYYDYEKGFELNNWNRDGFVEIDLYLQPLNQPMNIAELDDKNRPISMDKNSENIDVQQVNTLKKKTPTEQIYTTSDVFFYFDQHILTKEARYNIDRLMEDIDSDKLALIVVEGFADPIGTDEYNQQLSEKRAEEVANYFKSKGITNLKIIYKGYGESRPSLIYSKNRKVDIFVYYKI